MLVLNLFTDKVDININMLHPTMEHWVDTYAYGADIVTKYLRSGGNMKRKFTD